MAGLPYPVRLAGYGLRAPKNPVPGMDLAGVVAAVGRDVTRFQPGDEVFGIGKGTYAEYAAAPENKLASEPVNLTFDQAAVVAISGLTALQAVRDHAKVQPGQTAPVIDRTYPLSEAAAAVRYLKEGHARGKIVIAVHDAEAR